MDWFFGYVYDQATPLRFSTDLDGVVTKKKKKHNLRRCWSIIIVIFHPTLHHRWNGMEWQLVARKGEATLRLLFYQDNMRRFFGESVDRFKVIMDVTMGLIKDGFKMHNFRPKFLCIFYWFKWIIKMVSIWMSPLSSWNFVFIYHWYKNEASRW